MLVRSAESTQGSSQVVDSEEMESLIEDCQLRGFGRLLGIRGVLGLPSPLTPQPKQQQRIQQRAQEGMLSRRAASRGADPAQMSGDGHWRCTVKNTFLHVDGVSSTGES